MMSFFIIILFVNVSSKVNAVRITGIKEVFQYILKDDYTNVVKDFEETNDLLFSFPACKK